MAGVEGAGCLVQMVCLLVWCFCVIPQPVEGGLAQTQTLYVPELAHVGFAPGRDPQLRCGVGNIPWSSGASDHYRCTTSMCENER